MVHGHGRAGDHDRRDQGRFGRGGRKLLERFWGHNGLDMELAGVNLEWPDGASHCIHACLGVMLGDEPALKDVIDCKGHAGLKICVLCKDIVIHKTTMGGEGIHLYSAYAKSFASTPASEAERHTDESIRMMLARLRERHSAQTKLVAVGRLGVGAV